MRRTHRLSRRSSRWTSIVICSVLILSSLSLIVPVSSKSGFQQGQSAVNNRNVKKTTPRPPQPGAPAVGLPNLDNGRRARVDETKAPRAIESSVRSRRKPLESRHGRKVGDPLPPKKRVSAEGLGDGSERVSIASAETRGTVGTARLDHARTARSLPTGVYRSSLLAFFNSNRRLFNHTSLRFLRYPALQSDLNQSPDTLRASDQPFDLFLSPMPQSGTSKIVFASNREGSMQIYLMNGDGSGVTRLTYSGANDDYPRWSPNGTKILFQSDRDNPSTGYMDIYVMNSDGSGVMRLTSDPSDDSMASWSPDGTKTVFQSLRNGVKYQIYSMNADGSNQVCLTNSSSNDIEPSWSANGSKIAFASDRDHSGFASVYVMNSNGTGQQRITFSASTVEDRQPAWSRDGNKIAFVSTRDSTTETWQETDDLEIPEDDGQVVTKSRVHINKEVYVMNADGSGQLRLTNDLANDDAPSWSPDGTKIVFRSDRERDCCDPSAQVWTMNANGSGQADLSNDGAGNYTASWASGSGNLLPIANAGGTYSGTLAQNVPFHGTSSYDPDGTIVAYSWSFGDGGSTSGASPTHAYSAVGTYTVTLTVTDNLGAQGSASTTIDISSSSSDQFAQNFLQRGLGRSPNSNEGGYWTDIMRSAYTQGQTSMLFAMTEFGMTVFESAEYAGRNRTNHEFVYDLYKTYLMRDPDQEGWDFWTGVCNAYGRPAVRNAFEESSEFHNIVATLSASGNPSSGVSSLATARTDPFNQSGNQVQARDCEFTIPLLSLPGRAGLDLGLSVTYSSLVWTQSGPYVYFDSDNGGMGPGFSIGFPSIQGPVFDAQTGRNAYLLIAGGSRVELRQLGTSNIYESYDSSYLQLAVYGGGLTLRTTDGTQIGYGSFANGWQATSVEDRNGNVLTINNYWWGEIANITDTLGRILNFNYDGNANLTSITQSWSGQQQPHTWVTFGWGSKQLHPSFSSQVVGTFDGDTIPVLTMIGFADGSYSKFGYNDYAQVSQRTHYASDSNPQTDSHPLNWTIYIYSPAGADCPRVSEQRVSAENWTSVNDLGPYALTQFSDPGDGSRQMITPDNTVYKEFYGSGWQHGLVTSTQVITGSTIQKSASTSYVQDNLSVNYKTNPRATLTDISDGTNHSRTTIGYHTFTLPTGTSCSLPNEVYEYDVDQTVLRRTHTDYNLDSNYLSRRIIGLPQTKLLYQGLSSLMAKTTYEYDWGGDYFVAPNPDGIQHDSANYGSDFRVGRGNLSAVRRWDANYPDDQGKAIWQSRIAYNSLGSVYFTRDALDHQTTLSYADQFSDNGTSVDPPKPFATYAYPTTITDADNNSSTAWYKYDFGAKTRVQGPPPQNQPNGIVQTFLYDDSTRLLRMTTANTGAYSHYYYGPTYVQIYSSVNSVAANYWQSDLYEVKVFDGLGRVFDAATYHPGSNGGYRAVSSVYDLMGRLVMQSNPTEINGSWQPTGDDSGWVYTQQTYDWKGRPLERRHLIDGTVLHASYDGCGCAGGQVTTLTDEVGKQQRIYSDALGRQWKTETLNEGAIYSTSVSVFNARDDVTNIKQYSGNASSDASSTNPSASCPTGTCQEGSASFDGYGRLQSRHAIEQVGGTSTTFSYNPDNTPNSVTDARGASATYVYNNNRGLVNGINYYSPSGVANTPNVSFTYDAVGNRTSMTDGLGSVSYNYNTLSQLSSETRTFNSVGTYTLSYDYNLAGEVTRITDPTNASIYYGHDAAGRVSSVTGSPYGTGGYGGIPYVEVSQYASNMQYRAAGGLKSLSYGNGLTLAIGYDLRLRPSDFEVGNRPAQFGPPTAMKTQYQYYADNHPKFSHDLLDERFDRAFSFDNAGAMREAYSGSEARDFINNTSSGTTTGPYRQSYQHDPFGNMTNRTNRFWSHVDTFSGSYVNNRRQDPAFTYDADGHVTHDTDLQYTYDTVGASTSIYSAANNRTITASYDGVGRPVRRVNNENGANDISYYVWSSVTGKIITELYENGSKRKGNVYLGDQLLATQASAWVVWQHDDPIAGTRGISNRDGGYSIDVAPDPMGVDVGQFDPFIQPFLPPEPDPGVVSLLGGSSSCGFNPNCTRCYLDGFEIGCAEAMHLIDIGTAEFHTATTVNITYTNGHTESYQGYSNLPPGSYFSFTGSYAGAAAYVFNLLNLWTGNFNLAVNTSIASADVVRNSPTDHWGRASGWYGSTFSPSQDPGGAGGGAGPTLNTGPRASFDPKRFNKCLQSYFGIVLDHDDGIRNPFFDRRYGGSFKGFATGDPGHTYSVITKIDRNSATLAQQLNRANGTPNYWATQSGLTLGTDFMDSNGNAVRYGVNFVASDVAADPKNLDIGLFGLYIHEVGNALGAETGMDDPFGAYAAHNAKFGVSDPDVGAAFEICVFGGLVGLRTGRIGSHREF